MFDDLLVRKQAVLHYKKPISQSGHIGFFSKGVPHDCGEKFKITPCFVLGKRKSLEIMFDDRLVRKEVLVHYKKADFTNWPYWLFFKGGTT